MCCNTVDPKRPWGQGVKDPPKGSWQAGDANRSQSSRFSHGLRVKDPACLTLVSRDVRYDLRASPKILLSLSGGKGARGRRKRPLALLGRNSASHLSALFAYKEN
ncbi:hypothetical protein SKAU_G00365070 [Synaphobranchus kaupii]|uniref:Uncharacterized protein n=1 Tax=Synaphobranchus kaupii TaxID=118154 RepID=A0A9Q1EF04_SYNKA|nr:hypothetical protein SKAU_G00365070 [Synaphobranchus kaupii]